MANPKTFIEQLNAQKKKSITRLKGLVAVQACKDDIINGLNASFTLKEIYTLLVDQGRMPVTYSGFIKMVRKHIRPTDYPRKKDKEGPNHRSPEKAIQPKEPKGVEQLRNKDKGPRPEHVYNPDNYDPEELW